MEDVDWIEVATTVMVENRNLKRRIEKLEKEAEEKKARESQPDACDYLHVIAPKETGLPALFTMCTPAERKEITRRAMEKIVNGVYTGSFGGGYTEENRRPMIGMVTQRSKEEQRAGLRAKGFAKDKRHPNLTKMKTAPRISFQVTHLVLFHHGQYPNVGDQGSHLCHNRRCILIEHLKWEPARENNKRELICRPKGICTCGLEPPCRFDCK